MNFLSELLGNSQAATAITKFATCQSERPKNITTARGCNTYVSPILPRTSSTVSVRQPTVRDPFV